MYKIYMPASALKSDENLTMFIKENREVENLLKKITNNGDIVCLCGDYGVGKDIWARMIMVYQNMISLNSNPGKFKHLKFADRLRGAFNSAGYTNDEIDRLKRTETILTSSKSVDVDGYVVTGMTMRNALIFVAESNKQNNPRYYADALISEIEDGVKTVISDLRFEVEHRALCEYAKEHKLEVFLHNIPNDLPQLVVLKD